MGTIEGAMERESSSEAETSDASGDGGDDQDGGEDNRGAGASLEESTRVESPMPQEGCHRYDFLVCLYWNGLNFFELFKLLFFTWD